MAENINFSNNFTFTKVTPIEFYKIFLNITEDDGLTFSPSDNITGSTVTVAGDLTVTGNLNIDGDTVVNSNTKLSITDKNVIMNVPDEPNQPGGTSNLDGGSGDTVLNAIVVDPGVGFSAIPAYPTYPDIDVVFEASPLGPSFTATGFVTATGSDVAIGTPVTITYIGEGYVTEPTFEFGIPLETPAGNIPPREPVTPDESGTIVIRDYFDETLPHAGIIWNESEIAWDLNRPILQDIYNTASGSTNSFVTPPRIINTGDPVGSLDVVNLQTLLATELNDLADTDINSPSVGQVLRYTFDGFTNGWRSGSIDFADIGGITLPPSESGFFFWDHSIAEVTFVDSIANSYIDGLATVATSGTLTSLKDVLLTSIADEDILTWDTAAAGGAKWVNIPRSSFGTSDSITSSINVPPIESSTITCSGGDIFISADGFIAGSVSEYIELIATNNINLHTAGPMNLQATDIVLSTSTDSTGNISSEEDMTIKSNIGNVILQNVAYPAYDAGTAPASILVLNKASGEMEWGTLPPVPEHDAIQNSLSETFVSTSAVNDVVRIQAPNLGDTGVAGIITDEFGIILSPGNQRGVMIPGSGASTLYSDQEFCISTTFGNLDLSSAGNVVINDYIMPAPSAIRSAGDVVVINPADTVNKRALSFITLNANYLSDVKISGAVEEKQVMIGGSAGNFLNRQLVYSDIDNSTFPDPGDGVSIMDLDDTAPYPGDAIFLKNKYLRWNEDGNQVIYEIEINAESINFVGVKTNIEPEFDSTSTIGSDTLRFAGLYVDKINGLNWPAGDGTAGYVLKTDGLGSVTWSPDTGGGGGGGDVFLANVNAFTNSNSFITPGGGTFTVSLDTGDVDIGTNTGDVNITSTSGRVNVSNVMHAMKQDFTFAEAGTILIGDPLPSGAVVTTARVVIASGDEFTPATTPTLSIGADSDSAAIATTADINLLTAGLDVAFSFFDVSLVGGDEQIKGTLALGGATAGSGTILIEYYVL